MKLNAQDLKTHQWENRIVIVYSDDIDSSIFQKQMNTFIIDKKGMIERKLMVYSVVKERYELLDFKESNPVKSGTVSDKFKSRYIDKVSKFKVVLIGLDGSVKLEQDNILIIDKLFGTIDAMPMRRREMKKKR